MKTGRKVRALQWAISTKPLRPSRTWLLRDSPPRSWEDGDTVFVCGYILAFLVAVGWFYAVGWPGLFALFFVWGWFIRAAHRLEQNERNDMLSAGLAKPPSPTQENSQTLAAEALEIIRLIHFGGGGEWLEK